MNSRQWTFEAIGTSWAIDINDTLSAEKEKKMLQMVHQRIDTFDAIYSRFSSDSLITSITQKAGTYTFPKDAEQLISLYKNLYDSSDGLFTPLIGNVMEEAGYDASYSLTSKTMHTPPVWDEVLLWNPPQLTVKKPVVLDFGAGGKGYLVDLVSEVLQQQGISFYCIDAGGDILYRGDKSQRVGLEHPQNPKQVIGVATITNQSICGSAGNRRKWGNIHHIINPHTLTSVDDVIASWVVADSAIIADALATCLFFTDPEVLAKTYDFEYLLVLPDFSIKKSQHFPAELYFSHQVESKKS